MRVYRKFVVAFSMMAMSAGCVPKKTLNAQSSTTQISKNQKSRVFFVPLDDRPSTFLFVRQLARIGGVNLEVPERADLGSFYAPGKPEVIANWLLANTKAGDTVLLSSDMLAYGGLVASRMARSTADQALARLEVLKTLSAKGVKIEAFTILSRLSLTTSREEPADTEAKIREWAKAPGAPTPSGVSEKWLNEYLGVRKRNLEVAKKFVSFVDSGVVQRLVFGQDDANATGLHQEEQKQLRAVMEASHNKNNIELIQGADEIGMDVVAGWLARRANQTPTIKIVYSIPGAEQVIPPLESHTLRDMLHDHVRVAGAKVVEQNADVELFVQVPKQEKPFEPFGAAHQPEAEAFADQAAAALVAGKRVAIADLGIINRADPFLSTAILKKVPLWKLEAFAGWNTPANAFGTTVAHLVMRHLAQHTEVLGKDEQKILESEKTHQAFLIARMMDDYGYQHIMRDLVRADEKASGQKSEAIESKLFDPSSVSLRNHLLPWAKELYKNSFQGKIICVMPLGKQAQLGDIDLEAQLPWRRTFEVEARLDLKLVVLNQACQ